MRIVVTPKKHFESKKRRRTSPKLSDSLQDLHNNRTLVHESMVGTFHDFDVTTIFAHRLFHPSHCIFSNLLVLISIPDLDFVGVVTVREAPGAIIMVKNLQKVAVHPFRRFGVRRCNQGIAESGLIRIGCSLDAHVRRRISARRRR